jgi:hypothetical protein
MPSRLPTFEGTIQGRSVVDNDWSGVKVTQLQDSVFQVQLRLASALLEAARGRRAAAAAEHVRALALHLHGRTDLDHAWRSVAAEAAALAVFPAEDGAAVSLSQALAVRSRWLVSMLASHGVHVPVAVAAVAARPAAAALRAARSTAPADAAAAATTHAPAVVIAPAAPPVVPPAPADPLLTLAAQVAETLSLIEWDAAAERERARLPLSVARGKGKAPVTVAAERLHVDAAHPLVAAALAGDRGAYFLLCAVVMRALNAHLEQVTHVHERALLSRLMHHARSALDAAGVASRRGD